MANPFKTYCAVNPAPDGEYEVLPISDKLVSDMRLLLESIYELAGVNRTKSLSKLGLITVQLTPEQHQAALEKLREFSLEFQSQWDAFMATLDNQVSSYVVKVEKDG